MSLAERQRSGIFWGISVLLALAIYHFGANPPQLNYHSFSPLEWKDLKQCNLEAAKANSVCESKAFSPQGSVLEFEFNNTSQSYLIVDQGLGLDPITHTLPLFTKLYPKQSLRVELSADASNSVSIRVQLDSNAKSGKLAFRKRVNFYNHGPLHKVHELLNRPFSRAVLSFLLALTLVNLLLRKPLHEVSNTKLVSLFFIGTFAVHWRWLCFFWWDDWHVLERFIADGFPGAWVSHNEHFIPLFFSFYFVQIVLFGASYYPYLLVSLGAFTLNCVLVFHLMRRLAGTSARCDQAALICTALYAFSSLQSQLLQWTMVQCIVLSQTMILCHLLLALDFQRRGSIHLCITSLLSLAAALFLFANSFAAFPVCVGLLLIGSVQCAYNQLPISWKTATYRAAYLLVGALVVIGFSYAAYRGNKQGVGHTLNPASFFDNIYEVFAYMYTGAEFGTVLRGTGVFPSNALSAAETLYPRIYPLWLTQWIRPEVFFANLGFALSLVLLALYWIFRKDIRHGPLLWLIGSLTMFSAFILPALGRWHFGLKQALSLRYQHAALFGLVILLLPLVLIMLQGIFDRRKTYPKAVQSLAYVLKWLLILHFSIQCYLGSAPTHAVRAGIENRAFIAKLVDWRTYLDQSQVKQGLSYDYHGQGTKALDSYPAMPKVLTPGRSPDDIYRALHAVSPKCFPLETPMAPKGS